MHVSIIILLKFKKKKLISLMHIHTKYQITFLITNWQTYYEYIFLFTPNLILCTYYRYTFTSTKTMDNNIIYTKYNPNQIKIKLKQSTYQAVEICKRYIISYPPNWVQL